MSRNRLNHGPPPSKNDMSNFRPPSRSRTPSRSRSASRPRSQSAFLNFITGSSTGSGSLAPARSSGSKHKDRLYSLYRLLRIELNLPTDSLQGPSQSASSSNNEADVSFEELRNMAQIPFYLEHFMIFGCLICFNSFLNLFTLLPLKIIVTTISGINIVFQHYIPNQSSTISYQRIAPVFPQLKTHFSAVKKDFVTIVLIICSIVVLWSPRLDISRMYHDIRGSAHIKLYVMFGVLEVTDKLCSSLGQDILNIFHSIPLTTTNWNERVKWIVFFVLSVFYLSFHGYILIYQAVALNVAANSYSNALLALLLSNQFAELKGSVFKKFEREGLFQITMSDLCERFQLSIMLSIITLRNFLQLSNGQLGSIPNSWQSWNKWFGAIFGPGVIVIGSEIFVDWLKHCYISKFNKIRPRVYRNFLYVLSLDFLTVFNSESSNSSESDYVVLTKRIGLPLLATIVCFLRMTLTDLKQLFTFPVASSYLLTIIATSGIVLIAFATLLLIRLILGLVILKLANKIKVEYRDYQASLRAIAEPPIIEVKGLQAEAISTPLESETESEISQVSDINEYESSPLNIYSQSDTRESNTYSRNRDASVITLPYISTHRDNGTPDVSSVSPESPKSPIDLSFLPGIPNTEASSINPTTRSYLYDHDEDVPPTIEERRNQQLLKKFKTKDLEESDEGLGKVMRYEMSSKRIW